MKHITLGENQLFFSLLRDLPFFQPTTNLYAIALKSFDTDSEKTILVRDVSTSPKSYQQFFLTGSTSTEDLPNAVTKLQPYGMHYYTIYPVTGSTLSDTDASTVLARGIIYSKEI